jgi:hypothetical protein
MEERRTMNLETAFVVVTVCLWIVALASYVGADIRDRRRRRNAERRIAERVRRYGERWGPVSSGWLRVQ